MDSDAGNIVGLYDRKADLWDASRGRSLFEAAWLDRFLALLPACGAILDIGCGSGEPIARHFARRGHHVTGIDSSEQMIGLCRARLPDHDWHVADMRRLSLRRRFDGLIAWDSFFHLTVDDQRAMFPIFRAHAGRGTALMFTSGPSAGEVVGCYRGEDLYHASLDADEYRGLLDAHGFGVLDWAVEDPSCGGHTIWLAQAR